jgi:hypothetical protein
MPLESLSGLGIDIKELNLGDIFDELNNVPICTKYVIKKSQSQGLGNNPKSRNPKVSKLIDNQFKFHLDTAQLFRNTHRVQPKSLISISYKVHGCVSEDSIINTAEYGDKTIKEIVNNKINCHIKAYDVETKEIVYAPIDDHYLLKNDGEWFEIELENGVKLKITGNNPVWLPELNCYRKVSDLIENNVILFD